jgi:hypothetical protein
LKGISKSQPVAAGSPCCRNEWQFGWKRALCATAELLQVAMVTLYRQPVTALISGFCAKPQKSGFRLMIKGSDGINRRRSVHQLADAARL